MFTGFTSKKPTEIPADEPTGPCVRTSAGCPCHYGSEPQGPVATRRARDLLQTPFRRKQGRPALSRPGTCRPSEERAGSGPRGPKGGRPSLPPAHLSPTSFSICPKREGNLPFRLVSYSHCSRAPGRDPSTQTQRILDGKSPSARMGSDPGESPCGALEVAPAADTASGPHRYHAEGRGWRSSETSLPPATRNGSWS